ncbi:BCCT family transporter [Alkalihalobacillus sp. LMS6]|uniref:BCCT family transporter n=1 Tax=Alkalihalobacillus sp. LMS6 TaxID=2924034 RepID=UPI0020D1D365|nr:BCCT family transporter [Alkalihalobacillus sp. LMS6]UTR06930.1 BCCT family transporter [Alkalihalobacillus sp. LMS6]
MGEESTKKVGPVFYWSVGILAVIILIGIISPSFLESTTASIQAAISSTLGWYYLIIVTLFVLICLYLIISPYGKIKLGKPDEKPEYNYLTWFALLFSAGMGTGLLFWGTAEPISHFALSSPTVEEGTNQAALESMRFVFFHWGIHAWGIYAMVAISLAFFKFRREAPGMISATLSPIMNTKGSTGKVIDVIAIVATVSGIATTLGFGAAQMNGGLSYLWGVPNTFWVQLIIILIITVIFLISASTGINKGIRILSNSNMILALVLLLFFMVFGSTIYSLNLFTDTLGRYIQRLPEMSFRISPLNEENRTWINDWTIFYWAWWMAWSPYVGTFIARVSRGRTIREFTIGVLLVPSLVGFIWFAFLGGTAIDFEMSGVTNLAPLATEQMLFGVLEAMPLSLITSVLAIVLIAFFFITSGDSATFVLGMQSTNGTLNPSTKIKFTWGIMLSAIAIVLLYSGGLQALQNTMIIAALPFSIIMILMAYSLIKALSQEKEEIEQSRAKRRQRKEYRIQKQQINKEKRKEKREVNEQKKEEKRNVSERKKQEKRDVKKAIIEDAPEERESPTKKDD